MTISLLFWILMLFWLIFGVAYTHWGAWPMFGGSLLLWIIIALLGWKVFGAMIQG